jgi:hypothetical protein
MSESENLKGIDREKAAARLGLADENGKLALSKQSLLTSVGGWLGIVEAVLPALVFVTVLSLTQQAVPAVVSAVSISVFFLVLQIIRKKPLTQAIAGAIGIAISAFLPLREGGQAADYFLQGFFTNAAYLAALLISLLVRWPLIGVLVGLLTGQGSTWRKNKQQMRRYQAATFIWVGLFSTRLIVQVPLYFAGATETLGIFRIAMGVPLYALCIWFTWLLLRGVINQRG